MYSSPSKTSVLFPDVRPLLIRPHLALIALDFLLPLSTAHTTDRATLRRSLLLLLPFTLIHLHKPLLVIILVLALVSPLGHPLARSLVVHKLLAALLVGQRGTRLTAVLANALLACEQLPFGRRLRGRKRLESGQSDVRRRQTEQDAVLCGRGDVACREQLVQQALGAVAGSVFKGTVQRLALGKLQGVRVVNREMTQVEGVGSRLGDGDRSGISVSLVRSLAAVEEHIRTVSRPWSCLRRQSHWPYRRQSLSKFSSDQLRIK